VIRTPGKKIEGRRSYHRWLRAKKMVSQFYLELKDYRVEEVREVKRREPAGGLTLRASLC
jgi:hypothetical protein